MPQFLWGSGPPKKLTPPYAQIAVGVWTPKIIDATLCANSYGGLDPQIYDATLCVNSYGGLDPQKNSRDPMRQFLWGSRPPK